MKIGGLQKLTLLDYPGKVACTVFTVGCNLRCPFCHNASLVQSRSSEISLEELFAFLNKRRNVLEGMCLTGGEPLIQSGVEEFLRKVKDIGYLVKLDTNGAFPDRLQSLVDSGLVDYVAMDIKNSKEAYEATVGVRVDLDAICRSVELLKNGAVDYEFRTTVTGTFHSDETITSMSRWISGAKRLYLQQFVDSGDLIDPSVTGCDGQTLLRYKQIAEQYVSEVNVRGVDVQ